MPEQYLEIGKITNTHGVMGEVRVQPWADSPDFLCKFKTLYVDKTHWPIKVERARVHKNMVILKLEGVTDVPGPGLEGQAGDFAPAHTGHHAA